MKRVCLNRKTLIRFFLILAVVAGAVYGLRGEEPQAPKAEKPDPGVNVTVETVTPMNIVDTLTLPGQTEARHDVTLSAERGGSVESVAFTEGDEVSAGEIIAKIDVSALRAVLNRAQASFELAEKTADRKAKLRKRKVVSHEELDKANTDLALARNNLQEARVNYQQGLVTATVGGVINDLYVDPGEYVRPGDPVVNVVAVDTIRINVDVPEMDVRFLSKGDPVEVTVDAYPERRWKGVVDFVAFKANAATKTFKVRVVVPNYDNSIRPGMLARASFERRSLEGVTTAPLFAILDKGGERLVFVEKDGRAQARTVKVGVISGERARILKGLEPGDRLIVTGHTEVEEGTRVNVR